MSPSRVFGALEAELRRNLCFSFHILRNLSRHPEARLHPMDRFEMSVRLRNDSRLNLIGVRGVISPTALASFKPFSFKVERMAERSEREITRLEAVLVDLPATLEAVLQQIAVVSFSARADLSGFTFADLDRPLLWSPDLSEERPRATSRQGATTTRAIPLSAPGVEPAH